MTACRPPLHTVAVAAFVFLLSLTQSAHADPYQDAAKLLKQGQQAQALEQVDKYLAAKPNDAQGRFLKGVILTEMKRMQEAVAIFSKLTEDYPELPEPYNNLAVIYAQQRQYDKAKQALEMAIRTHPAYATAHENLGDIYARMASQAYDKALQLDSSNATAQTKLAMIRDLITISPRATHIASAAPATPAVAPPQIQPPPVAAAPKPAPVQPPPTPPAPPAPAPEAKRPPATTAPAPAAEPAKPVEPSKPQAAPDASDEVARAVENWTAAWSRKDIKVYIASYAKDFRTPGGMTRSAWEAERKSRVGKPGSIQVSVEGLHVSFEGNDRAVAKFRQHYRSASLKSSSSKVLVMVRQGGRWLIQQERIGS